MPWPMPCGFVTPACARRQTGGCNFLFLGPTGGPDQLAGHCGRIDHGDERLLRASTCQIWRTPYGGAAGRARLRAMSVTTKAVSSPEKVRGKPCVRCRALTRSRRHTRTSTTSCRKCSTTVALARRQGPVVDFTTIIIATSNLGSDIIQRRLGAWGGRDESIRKTKAEVMDVLRGHFGPVPQPHRRDHRLPCALGKERSAARRPAARSRGAQRRRRG